MNACLKLLPKGDCSSVQRAPIGEWDVSRVADMSRMFSHATFFHGHDISKWDVSNARDMSEMFSWAKSFNSDLSKWDVSSVTDMPGMFRVARSFNADISKWDVSSVGNMDYMFRGAMLFKRNLCGAAWVHSKASKSVMFADSPGSISRTVCTTTPSVFAPQSEAELKGAIDEYAKGDCPNSPLQPPIAEKREHEVVFGAGVEETVMLFTSLSV